MLPIHEVTNEKLNVKFTIWENDTVTLGNIRPTLESSVLKEEAYEWAELEWAKYYQVIDYQI